MHFGRVMIAPFRFQFTIKLAAWPEDELLPL